MSEYPDYHGLPDHYLDTALETDHIHSCEDCGCQWLTSTAPAFCPECGERLQDGDSDSHEAFTATRISKGGGRGLAILCQAITHLWNTKMTDRTYCETCDRWVGGGVDHNPEKHTDEEKRIEAVSYPAEPGSPTHYDGEEYESIAHVLAEETGKPVEEFQYDEDEYPQPDLEDLSTECADCGEVLGDGTATREGHTCEVDDE